MAKYFIDTEFIEGFHKPLFGKRRHFIDLISIGIYCEDGRSYYAISNEYNYNDADEWVKENVIIPMYQNSISGDRRNYTDASSFHKSIGKSNKQIMYDIVEFICPIGVASDFAGVGSLQSGLEGFLQVNPPEFYAYYADYDWVLFCSLFGRMIDLPEGFPMYCRDLKQSFDEAAFSYCLHEQHLIGAAEKKLKLLPNYPQQKEEHHSLQDAKWNFELYKFLQTI